MISDFFRRRVIRSLKKELAVNPPQEPYINYGKLFYDLADESKTLFDLGPTGAYIDRNNGLDAQSIIEKAIEDQLAPKGLVMLGDFNKKYIKPSDFVLNYYEIQDSALSLAKEFGGNIATNLKVRELMLVSYTKLRSAVYSSDSSLPIFNGDISNLKLFNTGGQQGRFEP